VAERLTGMDVREDAGAEQSIARASTALTAFVGRTLRGPVNRPVLLRSFADYERVFGGLWQPSTLSYAVEQYFESGGSTAVVVRVANGARPCTVTLPAQDQSLVLRALSPGTREFLRAAVDCDGIGENEPLRFNLVVQRVRSIGSEFIEDQEIYRRLSVEPGSSRFVAAALLESQLVRVDGDVPSVRPDITVAPAGRGLAAYVNSNPDGDDGAALTDYDIIGSAAAGTGLFALNPVETINFVCIPPLAREVDVGPSTLLVANRYCRERRALLLVDPPLAWESPAAAIAGLRGWGFASDNAVMFFPRLLVLDRLRGRFESFAPCGAVAGMLARADEYRPVWASSASEVAALRPGMRPLCAVNDADRQRLAAWGINVVTSGRAAGGALPAARTLAGPGAGCPDWRDLGRRRLAFFIADSIERGTRWMLFESNGPALWARAASQLRGFFESLEAEGAFDERGPDDRWFVLCDERINREHERDRGVVNVAFGFAGTRPGQFHAFLVTHRAGGSRVRSLNLSREQVESGHAGTLLAQQAAEPLARAG
jgi:phage tail sheath protein FI